MASKKGKLPLIPNDFARKATFIKRKEELMKKVSELSSCGIDVSAIVYSPYESQLEVGPNISEVQRVIEKFKKMQEMELNKKMVNQETVLRQKIAEVNEQLKKQIKDNREKEITLLMHECLAGKGLQNLMPADLNDLNRLIHQKLKEVDKTIEDLQKMAPNQRQAAPPPLLLPPSTHPLVQGQEHKPGT